MYAIAIGGDY